MFTVNSTESGPFRKSHSHPQSVNSDCWASLNIFQAHIFVTQTRPPRAVPQAKTIQRRDLVVMLKPCLKKEHFFGSASVNYKMLSSLALTIRFLGCYSSQIRMEPISPSPLTLTQGVCVCACQKTRSVLLLLRYANAIGFRLTTTTAVLAQIILNATSQRSVTQQPREWQ